MRLGNVATHPAWNSRRPVGHGGFTQGRSAEYPILHI